jgi:hypothetical protein
MAATDSASDQGEWRATLVDELNTTPPQTGAVIEAWPTEQAFIDAMADDVTLSDATGVGSQTASRLSDWFAEEYPERDRERREQSERFCTTYTTDHGLDADSLDAETFYWAFVCPRCETKNPCHGDPDGFAGQAYACGKCRWVPLLDAEAVREFRDEHYDGDAEGK